MKNKLEKTLIALSSGLFVAVAVVMMKLSGEGKTLQSLKTDLENNKVLLALKDSEARQESDKEVAAEQEEQSPVSVHSSTPASSSASNTPVSNYSSAAYQAPKTTPAPRLVSSPAPVAAPAPVPAPAVTTRTS